MVDQAVLFDLPSWSRACIGGFEGAGNGALLWWNSVFLGCGRRPASGGGVGFLAEPVLVWRFG